MAAKALIVGGAGFIGAALLPRLAQSGFKVTVFDQEAPKQGSVAWIEGDVRDLAAMTRAAADQEIIYNLAAAHRDAVRPADLYHAVNVRGAENTCIAAERAGIRSIVFTSSVAVYGESARKLLEDDPHAPMNEYGRTKSVAERVYLAWAERDSRRKLVIVRPAVVFGPDNQGNVHSLVSLVASGRFLMVGEGTNRKSMTYVENVADFLVHVAGLPPGALVFNYADEPDLTMSELVAFIREELGRSPRAPQVPLPIAIAIAAAADVVSRLINVKLPISTIRLRNSAPTRKSIPREQGHQDSRPGSI